MVKEAVSNVKEWKSTTVAVLSALVALGGAVVAVMDDDPATNPDWVTTIAALSAAISLLFARFK